MSLVHSVPHGAVRVMEKTIEKELLRLAKAGDGASFETLVTSHERSIYALALRILKHPQDAEDITQQTFLSALEHLDSFRGEAGFRTWLTRIATHAALKVLRKRNGLPTVSLDEATEAPDDGGPIPHPDYIADWRESPEHLVERRETARLIEAALEALDTHHRLVFLLRDVEGFSVRETADALGLSEANVKVRLLRARLRLRETLTQTFGDPRTRLTPGTHLTSSDAPPIHNAPTPGAL
jgi:RNA polymerase sigma-70 factor, ECF subfamily